jgi:hypothetical protein
MQLIETFAIKKGSAFHRENLLALSRDDRFKARTHLVYIYELAPSEPAINYPCGLGRVLYIGEASRETLPSGGRFGQHIAVSLVSGKDPGSNFTLTQYYHRGTALAMSVYQAPAQGRKQCEKDLLMYHVKSFGALPMAQGITGPTYLVTAVRSYRAPLPTDVINRHFVL